MFWNVAIKQEVLEKFWKSMYSYERMLYSFENHTLSVQGSFGLCYLAFKEAELIKGYQ